MLDKIIIAELSAGTTVSGSLCVKNANIRYTRAHKAYCDVEFTDGRSSITAKCWTWPTDNIAPLLPGTIVTLEGCQVSTYCNAMQLTFDAYKVLPTTLETICAFVPNRNYPVEQYVTELKELLVKICAPHPAAWAFVEDLFLARLNDYIMSTAACTMHHVQPGGLLAHTYETVMYALALYDVYASVTPSSLSPMSKPLIVVGALLHDIGKLDSYKLTDLIFTMTNAGKLCEHTSLGVNMILSSEAYAKYPVFGSLLAHCIAAHHGILEYGAAVQPACIEAYIISKADGISATLDTVDKLYEDATEAVDMTDVAYAPMLSAFGKQLVAKSYYDKLETEDVSNVE